MKIAITGAAGHLGQHLIQALAADSAAADEFIRIDMAPLPEGPGESRQANLADADATRAALEGADLIVHCASIHPWKPYADALYLDLNVKGTWNVYAAAAALGIRRVVMTSSIAAVGYDAGPERWPLTEDYAGQTPDIYSYTKQAQELIARQFAASQGIATVALRPPAFMPRPPLETGCGLLGAFTVVDDIVSAHVAAVRHIDAMPSKFEAFFVTNPLPYTAADADLRGDLWALADRHYPGVREWFKARGNHQFWMPAVYSNARAATLLEWQPAHSFATWWETHRQTL